MPAKTFTVEFKIPMGQGRRGWPVRLATARLPPSMLGHSKTASDISSVAESWMSAAYEDLRRGGPGREERVRRIVEGYLVPYFATRTTVVSDITYWQCHGWLLDLVGRDPADRTGARDGFSLEAEGDIGLAEFAGRANVSLTTARRRWQTGHLPGAYRMDDGRVRVPAQAVEALSDGSGELLSGLSQGYVADALWVLRRVLAFARANQLVPAGFDPTESLAPPAPDPARSRRGRPWRQPRPLTLAECARIASHLHPLHQGVLWLQRIMGLRVAECFGALVGDLVDLGGIGLLAVAGQGGRNFKIRDDHGRLTTTGFKPTLKTAAGFRVLPVPEKMLDLLRVGIDAFHTDPATGDIDGYARLIPGIRNPERGGVAAYQQAFARAAANERLSTTDLGFAVSSHLLRKSCATDLAWATGIEERARRRFMGHRAGDDVYGSIYTLDHPEVAPLRAIATYFDTTIASTISTLMVPTCRRVCWGKTNPLGRRADHIDATLSAAGWLTEAGEPGNPLCTTKRIAAELNVYPTTARRWTLAGKLPSVDQPDLNGVLRRHVLLSDLIDHADRQNGRLLLPEVAEELGLPYHEAYRMLHRLVVTVDQHPATREYELTSEVIEALREEVHRVRALHRRSMKLAAAACELRLALSTVALLSRRGALEVDPETDTSGARFVTRASVENYETSRKRKTRRRSLRLL